MANDILSPRDLAGQWYRDWFGFNELYARWAKQHGVNFTLLFCLYAIRQSASAPTPGLIASRLRLSKQTINSALDILESKGLLTRSVSPDNKRSRLIRLTPQGEAIADELLVDFYRLEEQVYGTLPPRDRKTLLRITRKLAARLEQAVGKA